MEGRLMEYNETLYPGQRRKPGENGVTEAKKGLRSKTEGVTMPTAREEVSPEEGKFGLVKCEVLLLTKIVLSVER